MKYLKNKNYRIITIFIISSFILTGCNVAKLFRDIDKYYKENNTKQFNKESENWNEQKRYERYRDSISKVHMDSINNIKNKIK